MGERYILGGRNYAETDAGHARRGERAAARRDGNFRIALAYAAGCVDTGFSRLFGREPQIPLEGVRMARHKMFVDASKAGRELGFAPGPIEAALERAVAWYKRTVISPQGARRLSPAYARLKWVPEFMKILVTFAVQAEFAPWQRRRNFLRVARGPAGI